MTLHGTSVLLDDASLAKAQLILASGQWPKVRIAREKGQAFAISRDRDQLKSFRARLEDNGC